MLMQREDARSLQLENYMHQIKFAKKDLPPPQLPSILVQLGLDSGAVQEQMQGLWAYRPVQPCMRPIGPANDNFGRFDIKIRLPKQLELDNPAKVKVLWSKEKETAEQEQRRREEIARKLKEQKMHLTKLVKFAQNVSTQKEITVDSQLVSKIDKVQTIFKQQIPDQKSQIAQLITSTKVELDKELLSQIRSNEGAKDKQQFQKLLLQEHQRMVQDISLSVAAISKLLPTSQADFNEYQVLPASQKVVQSETPLELALELNETDGDNSRRIDVKNENFGMIDVTTALSRYHRHLIHLDLSMNKIVAIQGGFDCPNLKRLFMSDNLIKEITPFMFQKCKNLRVLRLDINQISKITNLQTLTELTEFSLQNNKVTIMEGFSALTKLRRLDLSFNQIKKLEGVSSLQMLEFLELGKNQIDSVDAITSPNNKLVFLTELYLYMNSIKSFPKLSLPQLRSLNLNRNPLTSLQIGYCPMLETLTASYCQLNQIGSFQLCPSLKDLDVSFNQLQSLNQVLNALQFCDTQQMRTLCFNDNLFNQVISDEQQAIQVAANLAQHTHTKQLNSLITRVFPMLDKLNNAFVKPQKAVKCADVCADEQMMSLWRVLNATCGYRGFVNKQLSQKLFVTVFSGTPLMQLLKSLLPMKVLQRLLSFNLAVKSEENVRLLHDSMIFQNHQGILKQKRLISKLVSLYRSRKIRRQALINRIGKSQSLTTNLIKLQALIRGHICRVRNQKAVNRIRTEARKNTKGYKMATKVQAAFRGYLFRVKRQRALDKLKQKEVANADPFGDDEVFDAEAFLDVKKENLEQADIFKDNNLVEKYIQVLSHDYQMRSVQGAQMLGTTRPIGEKSLGLPPLAAPGVSMQATDKRVHDAKRSFDQNAAKQYFNAAGIAGTSPGGSEQRKKVDSKRGGSSSRRNIQKILNKDDLSEIDNQSDTRSMSYSKPPAVMQNNLMSTGQSHKFQQNQMTSTNHNAYKSKNILNELNDAQSISQSQQSGHPFYQPQRSNQHQKSQIEEKKKQIAEEWGFEKEETMMLWEARQKKRQAMKKKNEVLTADERFKRFQQNSQPLRR